MATPSQIVEALRLTIPTGYPIFLGGPPGVGKSALIRLIAEMLGYRLIDVRLAQMDPVDLRGVPSVLNGRTVFNPPACFPFADAVGNEKVILFFDEFTQSPTAVQNAALEPLLDHSLGGVPLGENVVVVGAGNRVEDRAGALKMTTAAASRFLTHLDLDVNLDDWQKWAVGAGIHPTVRSFLRAQPQHLHRFKPEENPRSFPCPRTWEHVSTMAHRKPGIELGLELYKGAVGEGAAASYVAHEQICADLPDPESVIAKPDKAPIPKDPAVMYGLTAALVEVIRQKSTAPRIGSLMEYLNRIPSEFAVLTILDSVHAGVKVLEHPAGQKFAGQHRDVIFRAVAR